MKEQFVLAVTMPNPQKPVQSGPIPCHTGVVPNLHREPTRDQPTARHDLALPNAPAAEVIIQGKTILSKAFGRMVPMACAIIGRPSIQCRSIQCRIVLLVRP